MSRKRESAGQRQAQRYTRRLAQDPYRDGRLTRPPGLNLAVGKAWDFYAKRLRVVGCLASVDAPMLLQLCEAEQDVRRYREKVDRMRAEALPNSDPGDLLKWSKLLLDATQTWRRLLADLGLKPIQRGAHAAESARPAQDEPADDLAEFKAEARRLRVCHEGA